jgi:hypothetical protein
VSDETAAGAEIGPGISGEHVGHLVAVALKVEYRGLIAKARSVADTPVFMISERVRCQVLCAAEWKQRLI